MIGRARAEVPAQVSVSTQVARSARTPPASGNAALAASAVVQGALGIEFTLSGLNKAADPAYLTNFTSFVQANPGSSNGPLSLVVQDLVLPNAGLFSTLLEVTELVLGVVLLVGAVEIGRRRLSGRLGARHGYEAALALVAALAGLTAGGLAFSIFVLMGGVLPTVMPGRAFTTAIPVELLIVPLGLSVAWLEFGRFRVLRRH
ncbi:MAG: hypothetical protein QOC97_522 [Chloroflexota bacterium]|jgi:hypothetical protein|nr:hypothetical protein [Chloroflexota bacterium]